MPDLYRAMFARRFPRVWVQDGTVSIQYRRFSFLHWLADLRNLQLVALDVNGGASEPVVMLAQPVGASYIRIGGGASNVTIDTY